VAAFDADHGEACRWPALQAGPSPSPAESGSCCNSDALNADELECLFRRTRHFETQFYSLANPLRDLVQRSRLRMASRDLRDRSDVVTFFIPFNDNVELARQWKVLDFYSSPLGPTPAQRRGAISQKAVSGEFDCRDIPAYQLSSRGSDVWPFLLWPFPGALAAK
jgi:hypothetical protein